jgi:hypothetical protein
MICWQTISGYQAEDIIYIWTREGRVYLSVILDLHSRRVIGWPVSNRLKSDSAIRAPQMAMPCADHQEGASIARAEVASIVHMTIRI